MNQKFHSSIKHFSVLIAVCAAFLAVSCNGFFGLAKMNDKGRVTAEPGMEVVHFIAGGESGDGARTAKPAVNYLEALSNVSAYTNWHLTATTDTDRVFEEKTWEYHNGVSTLVLYSDTKYNFTLTAEYKNADNGKTAKFSGTDTWESGQETISFVMTSRSGGDFKCDLTIPAIEGMTANVWLSEDVFRDDSDKLTDFTLGDGKLEFSVADLTPGKYYLSIILNDKGEETFIGPETVYILPALETVYSEEITDLNRTYKLKFSLDTEFYAGGSWAEGVTEAEKAVDVGLYRAFYDFPAVDKINPPAGYWYDGSWYAIIDGEVVVFDKNHPLTYSEVRDLITEGYEVTLYPHFRGGYITKDVNVGDIPTIVESSRIEPDEYDYSYSVKFGEDISDEIWNATIQVLGQKSNVTLDLSNISQEMFNRACPAKIGDQNKIDGNEIATLAEVSWLRTVILPTEGTKVPDFAFYCKDYANTFNVIFPDDSKYEIIGDYAFYNQQHMKLSVPEGIKEVGKYAYWYVGEYDGLAAPLPSTLERIGDGAFQFCRLNCFGESSELVIPENVVSIGANAFQQNDGSDNIKSVTFAPESKLESIGDSAFAYASIKSIELPGLLKYIGGSAFEGCEGLESVSIPAGIQVLPGTMLNNCNNVSVTVKSAFGAGDNWDNWFAVGAEPECISGENIVDSLKFWDESSYLIREFNVKDANLDVKIQKAVSAICPDEEPNENIIIPVVLINPTAEKTTIQDLKNANWFKLEVKWSTKESVMVDFSSLTMDSEDVDSVIWTHDILEFNDIFSSVCLPDGITEIRDQAFAYRTSITSITIPKSVTAIGGRAFEGCSNTLEVIYEGTEAEWAAVEKENAIPEGVTVTCKMGSGNRTYSVGDFILEDGTVLSKDSTPESGVAAVIVRAADGEKPALGVGIVNSTDGLAWCTESALGYNTSISVLQGDKTSGYMDGSEGWEKLKAVCPDAESNPEYYPAWNWCLNYASTNGLEGDLADGWYLPTLAELAAIQANILDVNKSLYAADGDQMDGIYWSCNQGTGTGAQVLWLSSAEIASQTKSSTNSVCCVRAFN